MTTTGEELPERGLRALLRRPAKVVLVAVLLLGLMVPAPPAATAVDDAEAPAADLELLVDTPGLVTVDDPLRDLQWYLDRTRASQAWSLGFGDPRVTVAVIDTGVDPDHRDLQGAFWQDPVTGRVGFDHLGGSFVTYVGAVEDWHGTAIAGIIAARANDGHGIAGVAPEVRVMVQRIYESESEDTPPSQATYARAVRAIDAALAGGADVLVLAWGGTAPNPALFDAIRTAGVPVVAAAGNDGQDLSTDPEVTRYPAMYRLPNLVTVAATDRSGRLLDNERLATNYGVRHVDLAAPGVDILSTAAGGGHRFYEGTSFAAPQVAAALALGRSVAPGVPASGLVSTLVSTTRRRADLAGRVTSGGELDVAAFLDALSRPACTDDLPPRIFSDVARTSTHVRSIDCIAVYGITSGIDADRFAPRRTITRAEMAAFLERLLVASGYAVPAEVPSAFTDTADSIHARAIDVVADAGIASGIGDGRFGPSEPVTRAQMAAFVVRTIELLADATFTSEAEWFDDIVGNPHERSILVSRDLGITRGTGQLRTFEPYRDLTREQMATFLAQTMDALGRLGVTVARPS